MPAVRHERHREAFQRTGCPSFEPPAIASHRLGVPARRRPLQPDLLPAVNETRIDRYILVQDLLVYFSAMAEVEQVSGAPPDVTGKVEPAAICYNPSHREMRGLFAKFGFRIFLDILISTFVISEYAS